MRIIKIIFLVATLIFGSGCTPAPQSKVIIESYSMENLTKHLEQGIYNGESAVNIQYTEQLAFLQSNIQKELPKILNSNYLCSKLLGKTDVEYSQKAGYTQISIALTYGENVQAPVVVVTSKDQILSALLDGWEEHLGKATLILQGFDCTEDEFFSLLDTAEINSASLPCEAQRVYYEEFEKSGDLRIVNMWLDFPVDEETLLETQAALDEKIRKYANAVCAQHPAGQKETYKAIYDCLLETAGFDEAIAYLSEAKRLSSTMYLERSAYGALVSGNTICNGYARGVKAICDYLKLPCWVVSGTYNSEKHSWNAVFVEGKIYYIDCTKADLGYSVEETFFLDKKQLILLGYIINEHFLVPEMVQ